MTAVAIVVAVHLLFLPIINLLGSIESNDSGLLLHTE